MSGVLLTVAPGDLWTTVTLNDPPRNVLGPELLASLVETLDRLRDAGASPLLLRSSGRHFSTGYPIADIPEEIFHHDPEVRAATVFEQVMDRLSRYPAPIVAAVQGDAYGGAVELLACVDMRLAAEGVRVGVPAVRLGLVYSPSGVRRLLRCFGSPLARELLLLGEPVTAERARQAGFFNRVVPATELEAVAAATMESLTRGVPAALRGTRRLLQVLEDREVLPEDLLAEIAGLREASRNSEEFARAQAAFLARKAGS